MAVPCRTFCDKFPFRFISLILLLNVGCFFFLSTHVRGTFAAELQDNPITSDMSAQHGLALATLSASLIDDVLDILPKQLADQIAPDGNFDDIMDGVFYDRAKYGFVIYSIDSITLGTLVAYVVETVYGNPPPIETKVPETAYIEKINVDDYSIDEIVRKANISQSNKPDRDRYNICLNIVTSLWTRNFNKLEGAKYNFPKQGLYMRDNEKTLYAIQEEQE
jgi:hypothetical protein